MHNTPHNRPAKENWTLVWTSDNIAWTTCLHALASREATRKLVSIGEAARKLVSIGEAPDRRDESAGYSCIAWTTCLHAQLSRRAARHVCSA
jgi:hypothetical protein